MKHEKIYAFVCPEQDQGILSMGDSLETQKPLVVMSKRLAESLIPMVKESFSSFGKRIELREYSMSLIIETINSGGH